MQTNPNTMEMDAAAQRRLQNVLDQAQRIGMRAMRRLADRYKAGGKLYAAGTIYEALGHNRRAADAYLKGERLGELKRMIEDGKLIMKGTWAERAFELAARQGEWRAAEELAIIVAQRRVFGLGRWFEPSFEAEIMVACARDRYYGGEPRLINMEFTAQEEPDVKRKE